MADGTFATAINCMDGRTQLPVIEFMKKKYSVDYVDTITEPGPIKYLSENSDQSVIDSIKYRVDISVRKHGSKAICIVGHFGCAGNPVDRGIQIEQLKEAEKTIKSWGFEVDIVKVYIDENWQVQEV